MALELALSVIFIGISLILSLVAVFFYSTNETISVMALLLMLLMLGSGFWLLGLQYQTTQPGVADVLYKMIYPIGIFLVLTLAFFFGMRVNKVLVNPGDREESEIQRTNERIDKG